MAEASEKARQAAFEAFTKRKGQSYRLSVALDAAIQAAFTVDVNPLVDALQRIADGDVPGVAFAEPSEFAATALATFNDPEGEQSPEELGGSE